MYLNVYVCDEFLSSQKLQKNEISDFSGPTCVNGYLIHILYVNVVLEKFR